MSLYWVWWILHLICRAGADFTAMQLQICRDNKLKKAQKRAKRRIDKLITKQPNLNDREKKELAALLEDYRGKGVIIAK